MKNTRGEIEIHVEYNYNQTHRSLYSVLHAFSSVIRAVPFEKTRGIVETQNEIAIFWVTFYFPLSFSPAWNAKSRGLIQLIRRKEIILLEIKLSKACIVGGWILSHNTAILKKILTYHV